MVKEVFWISDGILDDGECSGNVEIWIDEHSEVRISLETKRPFFLQDVNSQKSSMSNLILQAVEVIFDRVGFIPSERALP